MDSLRSVLVIIGLLIILGLLGHGLWTIRKNNQVAKDKRDSLERKRRRPPEDLFSAASGSESEADSPDPLASKMTGKPGRGKKGVHIEQADVAYSGKGKGARVEKREPAMDEEVDEHLLEDERFTSGESRRNPGAVDLSQVEAGDPEIEQMEINLDDEHFAASQHIPQQPGLLDDDEPRMMSADESAIEAADDIEEALRGAGKDPDWTAEGPETSVAEDEQAPAADKLENEPETPQQPDIEVITLFVTGDIQGAILLQMTTELGLKYGEMDIFHRHLESSGHGPVLFSVANMFNPGTFDIHNMERFETEGIVLFMTLPLKSDGHQAFTMMYNAANKIADAMPRAAVLDGNRNPVTKQSVQHTYQRIREFERKQRLQKPTPQWS